MNLADRVGQRGSVIPNAAATGEGRLPRPPTGRLVTGPCGSPPAGSTRAKSMRRPSGSARASSAAMAGHAPARCQSRNRRQHVIPEPKPRSSGSRSNPMPRPSTTRMPESTARSSSGLRPGCRLRRTRGGISGAIRAQTASEISGSPRIVQRRGLGTPGSPEPSVDAPIPLGLPGASPAGPRGARGRGAGRGSAAGDNDNRGIKSGTLCTTGHRPFGSRPRARRSVPTASQARVCLHLRPEDWNTGPHSGSGRGRGQRSRHEKVTGRHNPSQIGHSTTVSCRARPLDSSA
jgi:hypothetical protein